MHPLQIGLKVAKTENVQIEVIESGMADLSAIASASKDLVISMPALMYVEDINKVFKEVNRVFKKRRTLYFQYKPSPFYGNWRYRTMA